MSTRRSKSHNILHKLQSRDIRPTEQVNRPSVPDIVKRNTHVIRRVDLNAYNVNEKNIQNFQGMLSTMKRPHFMTRRLEGNLKEHLTKRQQFYNSVSNTGKDRLIVEEGALAAARIADRNVVQGSMEKGGNVKKTGLYRLHKGEKVIPAKKAPAKK